MADKQVIEMTNFTKGLITRAADEMIPAEAFSDCLNVDLSEKFIPKSIKGFKQFADAIDIGDGLTHAIKGGIVFREKDMGEVVIAACAGFL